MRLERKLSDLLPPNVNAEQVKGWIIALLTITTLMCGILLLCSYPEDYRELFLRWGTEYQTLRPGAIIPEFDRYAIRTVYVIGGALLLTLASTALLYSSYYQGSRSIYLMRRLSNKNELRRRVWTVPLLWAGTALLLTVALFWIFYGSYMLKTPSEVLENHQLLRFWQDLTAGKIGG